MCFIYEEYCKAKGITPEIFRCDYEGINALFDNPAEAVFLDDNEANVVSSRAFGLHTIHFKSYEQAKAELEALLAE